MDENLYIISKAAGICYTTNRAYIFDKIRDLRIGHERYTKIRQLNAMQFSVLYNRNITGEKFDQMVDEL